MLLAARGLVERRYGLRIMQGAGMKYVPGEY
jgi:hypothetical protein